MHDSDPYSLDRTITFEGIHYTVIDVLDNGLLLVVPTEDLKQEKFPLNPVVVPNED